MLRSVREAITSGIVGAAIAIALAIVAQQVAHGAQHRQWLRDRRAQALETFYGALHSAEAEIKDLVRWEYWGEEHPREGRDQLYDHRRSLRDLASRLDLVASNQVRLAAEVAREKFDWCVARYTGDRLFNDRPTVAVVDAEGNFVGGSQSMIFSTDTEAVDEAGKDFTLAIDDFRRCARDELGSASSRWWLPTF